MVKITFSCSTCLNPEPHLRLNDALTKYVRLKPTHVSDSTNVYLVSYLEFSDLFYISVPLSHHSSAVFSYHAYCSRHLQLYTNKKKSMFNQVQTDVDYQILWNGKSYRYQVRIKHFKLCDVHGENCFVSKKPLELPKHAKSLFLHYICMSSYSVTCITLVLN